MIGSRARRCSVDEVTEDLLAHGDEARARPGSAHRQMSYDIVFNGTMASPSPVGDDSKPKTPQFAVVKLSPDINPAEFYSLLSSNGHMEVSFVHDLWDSPYLQRRKEELIRSTEARARAEVESVPGGNSATSSTTASSPLGIAAALATLATPMTSVSPLVLSPPHEDKLAKSADSPQPSESPLQGDNSSDAVPIRPRPPIKNRLIDAPTVQCNICANQIMATRMSNLTNHVRRHASLKQYSCIYCSYSHNEMAKVRLHMLHNHKDSENGPLDNLTPEMQAQWDRLMDQCFPNHHTKIVRRDRDAAPFVCIECGEKCRESQIETHIGIVHAGECQPVGCGKCGYENADEWKVRLHIIVRHSSEASTVSVKNLPAESRYSLFKTKYFPSTQVKDDDEINLMAQLQEFGKFTNAELSDTEVTAVSEPAPKKPRKNSLTLVNEEAVA